MKKLLLKFSLLLFLATAALNVSAQTDNIKFPIDKEGKIHYSNTFVIKGKSKAELYNMIMEYQIKRNPKSIIYKADDKSKMIAKTNPITYTTADANKIDEPYIQFEITTIYTFSDGKMKVEVIDSGYTIGAYLSMYKKEPKNKLYKSYLIDMRDTALFILSSSKETVSKPAAI